MTRRPPTRTPPSVPSTGRCPRCCGRRGCSTAGCSPHTPCICPIRTSTCSRRTVPGWRTVSGPTPNSPLVSPGSPTCGPRPSRSVSAPTARPATTTSTCGRRCSCRPCSPVCPLRTQQRCGRPMRCCWPPEAAPMRSAATTSARSRPAAGPTWCTSTWTIPRSPPASTCRTTSCWPTWCGRPGRGGSPTCGWRASTWSPTANPPGSTAPRRRRTWPKPPPACADPPPGSGNGATRGQVRRTREHERDHQRIPGLKGQRRMVGEEHPDPAPPFLPGHHDDGPHRERTQADDERPHAVLTPTLEDDADPQPEEGHRQHRHRVREELGEDVVVLEERQLEEDEVHAPPVRGPFYVLAQGEQRTVEHGLPHDDERRRAEENPTRHAQPHREREHLRHRLQVHDQHRDVDGDQSTADPAFLGHRITDHEEDQDGREEGQREDDHRQDQREARVDELDSGYP